MNCKAIDGLIRYLTRVIPDGLLLSIAHVRFTWFNKCKRFAGLNFKCKLEVGLIIKTVNFFQDEAIVSTLAQSKIQPSDNWLGNHSPKKPIRESGLWQVQGLKAPKLTDGEFEQLQRMIE